VNVREWALPVYTILVQLATGGLIALWLIRWRFARVGEKEMDRMMRVPVLILFSTIALGIVGAHFHLSKPFLSILAVTNLAYSWLSREITATVLFFITTGILASLIWFVAGHTKLKTALGWLAILFGLFTVYCMARVYLLPTQFVWNSGMTILSYFIEAALIGATSLIAILLMDLNFRYEQDPNGVEDQNRVVTSTLKGLAFATVVALLATLTLNIGQIVSLSSVQNESAQMSIKLLSDLYQPLFLFRIVLGVVGVGWFLLNYYRNLIQKLQVRQLVITAYIACTLVLVGEVLGRFLFYAIHVRSGI
jgi:anaerobic dimethyl sulfoxide reductase subunit C (anchor subunit)